MLNNDKGFTRREKVRETPSIHSSFPQHMQPARGGRTTKPIDRMSQNLRAHTRHLHELQRFLVEVILLIGITGLLWWWIIREFGPVLT